MFSNISLLVFLLRFAPVTLAWTIPNIELPTFTYQCMPMELLWRDGSPPYSVWFNFADQAVKSPPDPNLGAWYNLTGGNYLVPCKAPAGSTLFLVLKDSTGWISMSLGTFVVLPSSDSSCLTASDDSGLAQSQSTLSTILWNFQQSVVSAISVSATAIPAATTSRHVIISSSSIAAPVASTSESSSSEKKGVNLARIVGPALGCLVGILIGIAFSICYFRRRKRQLNLDPHIPLTSSSAFDLLEGEQERHTGSRAQETRVANADQSRQSLLVVGVGTAHTPTIGGRLQLHDGSAFDQSRTEKGGSSMAPVQPNPTPGAAREMPASDSSQPQSAMRHQNLEQRAEELSAPELERLAALVARRLERVRGAPPQYRATDDAGV